MVSDRVLEELNKQMNAEFESAYLYLSMAAYLDAQTMPGMSSWMRGQYDEEREHALKFFNFILERNNMPVLSAFDKPKNQWTSVLNVFEDAYAHEQKITTMINNIYDIAMEEKDYPTKVFLDWFIDEQVEEESTVLTVVDQLKMIKDSPEGLFFFDKELGKRESEKLTD
jgi:ferritin